ncbi:hypothetical protein [Tautonia rosea]|uniref:hypothetical protein n=1 Tax=Tautonia rosea TaxID=2728037 RepID=UPI00147612F3|nr:hypothetical protein [Tautonia rosea]
MKRVIVTVAVLIGLGSQPARAQQGMEPTLGDRVMAYAGNLAYEGTLGVAQGLGSVLGEAAGTGIKNFFFPSNSDGTVDTQVFQDVLKRVEASDAERRAEIAALREQLRDTMTHAEVHTMIMNYLSSVNEELAEISRQVQEQRRVQEIHASILANQSKDILELFRGQEGLSRELLDFRVAVEEDFERQSERLNSVEEEMKSLRRDYPRYRANQQGELLAVGAIRLLEKGDHREALRSFRYAHAYDLTEPCYLYGMALAYRGLGEQGEAEVYAARGIAADRKRSLVYSRVWQNMSYRIQGPDRRWLEGLREDPVYGVKVPGMVSLPATLLD